MSQTDAGRAIELMLKDMRKEVKRNIRIGLHDESLRFVSGFIKTKDWQIILRSDKSELTLIAQVQETGNDYLVPFCYFRWDDQEFFPVLHKWELNTRLIADKQWLPLIYHLGRLLYSRKSLLDGFFATLCDIEREGMNNFVQLLAKTYQESCYCSDWD